VTVLLSWNLSEYTTICSSVKLDYLWSTLV
jgi:hypothetical protein